ncbi:protein SIEVE ELEMENT OCCLUSION B-like [Momordica charantia]|uniref:Protein SIEVE ELEMENT OCCLUSION B-like n=1 Tax=Momordica charantia TaxID=3673 RepID=A0A6J1C9C4_MOMCH|nr:protein SIEVE ELEMENT OCCLUSION B-like [Momordica charantia]
MSVLTPKTPSKEELSLRKLTDDVVAGHIYAKHRDDDDEKTKIDVNNYISFLESTLANVDQISEAFSRGHDGRVVYSDDSYKTTVTVDPPADILQKISNELAFKTPGIEKAHQTTLAIFDILISHPWEAKAILTLAAFATDHGIIWHLNHHSNADPLAKSLATMRQSTSLKKHLDSIKYRQVVLSPNSLIHSCLLVIKRMNQVRIFSKYDSSETPELSSALRQIPLFTYWVIHAIVASRTEISSYLTGTESQSQQYLNELSERLNAILSILESQLNIIGEQQEELNLYRWLVDHIDQFPTEITLVVSKLLEGKTNAKPLINGLTHKEERIEDALGGKNVILLVSGLDISEEDLRALHLVHDELKKEDNYKIVWIPVMNSEVFDEEQSRKRYEHVRSAMKWYVVQYTTKIAGLRFVEEKWQLRDDALMVVLDSKSKVKFTNAIHLLRVWGTNALPFSNERANTLLRKNWPESTIVKFSDQPRLQSWINQERSIIFYGGKDPEWIQRFEEKVVDIKNDRLMKDNGIAFEIVPIGNNSKGAENSRFMSRFWITQWGFFVLKSQLIGSSASETTEDILRLISYENEDGWAVLVVGSAPLLVGRGNLVLAVFEDFNKWKHNLNMKGFPNSFKDHFNELAPTAHQCERVTLPGFSGWIPMIVNCPECTRFMETGINFKCCHGRGANK